MSSFLETYDWRDNLPQCSYLVMKRRSQHSVIRGLYTESMFIQITLTQIGKMLQHSLPTAHKLAITVLEYGCLYVVTRPVKRGYTGMDLFFTVFLFYAISFLLILLYPRFHAMLEAQGVYLAFPKVEAPFIHFF